MSQELQQLVVVPTTLFSNMASVFGNEAAYRIKN